MNAQPRHSSQAIAAENPYRQFHFFIRLFAAAAAVTAYNLAILYAS